MTLEDAKALLESNGFCVKQPVRVPPDIRLRLKTPHCYTVLMPDAEMFLPFIEDEDIVELELGLRENGARVLITHERLGIVKALFRQTLSLEGEVWEAGTFQGGTARFLRRLEEKYGRVASRGLRLFDTFSGMPDTNAERDLVRRGDFSDTSLQAVRQVVGEREWVSFHQGLIPASFVGLETKKVRFAHIDLDIYQGILDATAFIYSRLVPGGVIVYDDYGWFLCPGARDAVDEFYSNKAEVPLVLASGQAIVTKL